MTDTPVLSDERIAALEALALGEMPFYERIAAFHGITINAAWSRCLDSGTEFTHACDPQTILALCALLRGTSEDTRRLDAIERGDVDVERMGTTVVYHWARTEHTQVHASPQEREPKSLRQAIDEALQYEVDRTARKSVAARSSTHQESPT